MKILFICKYNRFRSRVAESYFKQLNKNKSIKVRSAGIIRGAYPLDKNQVRISKQLGVRIKGRPKSLSEAIIKWPDLFVIVADNVPSEIISAKKYHKRLEVWKIKDAQSEDTRGIRRAVNQIKKRVEALVKQLK